MDSKLRLLVVTPDYPPGIGGVQRLVHRIVAGCHSFDVLVVTLGAYGWSREDEHRVRRVARRGGQSRAIASLNAAALVEALNFRPDLVLSAHVNAAPCAQLIRRFLRVPYVQYAYGREIVARGWVSRIAFSGAARIVALSGYTQDLCLKYGADPDRIAVIPPGVDSPPGGSRLPLPGLVLVVSRLDNKSKGHDVLLQAVKLARAEVPYVRLVIAGEGRLRAAYEREALRLGLGASVDFVGAVDEATKWDLLFRAAVFAMPARIERDGGGEGFGIVFLEAAACGVPTVAGRSAGAPDAIVDGVTGVLVDPEDPEEVARALIALLTDTELAERLGAAGIEWARKFRWSEIAPRVQDVLLAAAETPR